MNILRKGLAVVVLCGLAAPARAQSAALSNDAQSSSGANEAAGATTGLGSSHRFSTADAAAAHCPGDVVVWSPGHGLGYVLPGAPGYAAGEKGFYACKMEADDAGFSAAH